MAQSPIVILGAGIGGLTLGRCLRQKGVPSIIYDRASTAPRHTYGITLEPRAYKPLLHILDIDEPTFRRRVAVDNSVGRVSAGDPIESFAFRANRNRLESLLREGLTIHQEHSLSSASLQDDGGPVELKFQNGLKLRPKQVVDALGVHSQLRRSLCPNIALEVQPFAVYSGKRYIKADLFASTYAPGFGNGNVCIRSPSNSHEPRLEMSVNCHLPDNTVSISYIYSRAAHFNSTKEDPLHHPQRPVAGATDIPEDLYDEVDKFLSGHDMGEALIESFNTDEMRADRILHWLMRTIIMPKPDLLQLVRHGIVLTGDSAHAVPILGGHGANMAITDAINLANILALQDQSYTQLERFYEDTWQEWQEAVEESKKSLARMHMESSISQTPSNL